MQELTVVMDRTQAIGRDYQVQGIPKTVVVDQRGIVRLVEVGFAEKTSSRITSKINPFLGNKPNGVRVNLIIYTKRNFLMS